MNEERSTLGTVLITYAALYLLVVANLVVALAGVSGIWALVVAMGIAGIQALVVALFSMELLRSRRSIGVVAVIAPLFVLLLVSLTVVDVYTRAPSPLEIPPIDRTVPSPPPSGITSTPSP